MATNWNRDRMHTRSRAVITCQHFLTEIRLFRVVR
jgi:hypothetical protein